MKVYVNDYDFNHAKVPMKISLAQWLKLKLSGAVKVFDAKKAGWTGTNPFYIFKCSKCNEYGLDYPHGYWERLDCPVCNKIPEFEPVLAEAITV